MGKSKRMLKISPLFFLTLNLKFKTTMKTIISFCLFLLFVQTHISTAQDYNISPVPFNKVHLNDDFWAKRIKTNREVTIPIAFSHCEKTGRIDNFKIAGGLMTGEFKSGAPFDDSDVSKIIEGAAYSLSSFPDPELEAYVDSLIWFMGEAQEADGYLYTYRTIMGDDSHPWIGSKRWEKTHLLSHELYNLGHMYEAGVAYYQATGKRNLLDISLKSADLLCRDFGWDALVSYPGHQEVEIGLVKLYRTTGEKKYLDLAKFFLDARAKCAWEGNTYDQSHIPVVEQDEAVGHSVRALYMFTAMADVAALTGDNSYVKASEKLWNDIVMTKLYITGGVGAAGGHEGFGAKYELPNASAYCETCAAVANAFWNHRYFLMEGDSKYIDVLERSLYNNILSGVSVTGDHFFYPNPLESVNGTKRSEWFGCACCPSNISRFIPNVPGYIYAVKDNSVFVNLYMAGEAELHAGGTDIKLMQSGNMPWDGHVELVVDPVDKSEFTIKMRIPGWARNEVVPGNELYWFKDKSKKEAVVKVNGKTVPGKLDKGYVTIKRQWHKGDRITLDLPMEIRRVVTHENVEGNRGKVALQRGPLVYCSEGVDFSDPAILDLVLPDKSRLHAKMESNAMGKMMVISGKANQTQRLEDGSVKLTNTVDFKAIPYYAWAHRGLTPMMMWYPTNKDVSKPKPAPTIANLSKIDGSINHRGIEAIRDQILPAGSNDRNCQFFHWWPHNDTTEWISYTFDKPYTISKTKIFWYNDDGGCRPPASWRLYYLKEGEWIEVKAKNEYGIQLDIINTTDFEPVTTTAVKLEVDLPKTSSSGMHEWIIE